MALEHFWWGPSLVFLRDSRNGTLWLEHWLSSSSSSSSFSLSLLSVLYLSLSLFFWCFIDILCWAPWISQVQGTGHCHFFLEHSLGSACTCAHCTFAFMRNKLSELMRKENITFIYSVYIFYIKTTKQTDIQKNSKTTTTTTKDMYTNCNRKTQQCILIDQCPYICSQKGFFKL